MLSDEASETVLGEGFRLPQRTKTYPDGMPVMVLGGVEIGMEHARSLRKEQRRMARWQERPACQPPHNKAREGRFFTK